MPFEDLISKYGGGAASNKEAVETPHADLINKYGSGDVEVIAPKQPVGNGSNYPVPLTDAEITASQNQPTSFSGLPIIRDINIGKHINENYKSSVEMAESGLNEITSNKSASGFGKLALGAFGAIGAPVTGLFDEGEEQLGKLSGNPEFAKRAGLAVTSGLPIGGMIKAATATMPSTRAVRTIVDAIGPENIPKVITELQSNPRLSLVDVNPNVQIINQGLAAKPGKPRDILDTFVNQRKDTQKDIVVGAFDEAMGAPVSVKQKIDTLKKNIKSVGSEIDPILKNTKPIDVTPVIASIDAKLKPGVNSVISAGEPLPTEKTLKALEDARKYLTTDNVNLTDPARAHRLQSSLRLQAEGLLNSQNPEQRQIGYHLMQVRQGIVNAIDKVSPQIADATGNVIGSYKKQLSKYRDENDIQDAFQKGQLITRNKLGRLEDHPEFWDEWIQKATPQEIEAAREGARLAVSHQMGAMRFAARKGMEVPESEFNSQKLSLLFGKEETNKLTKTLSDERKIADSNTKLFQNSQTAMRLLGAEATAERPKYKPSFSNYLPLALEAGTAYYSGGSVLGAGALAGYGYEGVRKTMNSVGRKLDRKTNVEIANLSSSVGEARDNLIKALQDYVPQQKLTMKQKLQLALPVANP